LIRSLATYIILAVLATLPLYLRPGVFRCWQAQTGLVCKAPVDEVVITGVALVGIYLVSAGLSWLWGRVVCGEPDCRVHAHCRAWNW
jgi:hypothetical protein